MSTSVQRASEAAREGNVSFFSSLSDGDWSRLVGAVDADGRSLLHWAAASGHLELAQLIAQRGVFRVCRITSKH